MSAIEALITELARLPGIGRKTAQRLTFHLLQQSPEQAGRLAAALVAVSERVRACDECGNLTEEQPCAICRDPRRDPAVLCVVEEASAVAVVDRSTDFRGRYHVLGGRLSPLDGVGPEQLNLAALRRRLGAGSTVREVILATNPSVEGEATAHFVERVLQGSGIAVSRLARGLPVGSELEYADGETIAQAIAARRPV